MIKNILNENGYTNNISGLIDALSDLSNEDETQTQLLKLLSTKFDKINSVLVSLIETIKKDFGTGNGDEIDENLLNYPELASIYHNAVKTLEETE